VGQLLLQQGIDQAGLAYIGAAEEGKLRRAGNGEVGWRGGGGEKLGDRFHSNKIAIIASPRRAKIAGIGKANTLPLIDTDSLICTDWA
jgi:hypothetical protein